MPDLITDAREIYKHVREHYPGGKARFVCSECKKSVMVAKVDHGPVRDGWDFERTVHHADGTFDLVKKEPHRSRYEHIGYWCPRCRVFYPLPAT